MLLQLRYRVLHVGSRTGIKSVEPPNVRLRAQPDQLPPRQMPRREYCALYCRIQSVSAAQMFPQLPITDAADCRKIRMQIAARV